MSWFAARATSAVPRPLARKLDASPGLRVAAQPRDLTEAWSLVRSLQVYAVVYLPANAARDLQRLGSGTVFSYYNASYLTACLLYTSRCV